MKIYITRKIPDVGIKLLRDRGYEVDINGEDKVLSKMELIEALGKKDYDGVLCLLTDKIDAEIFDSAPNSKIFANYAVGYNNIDIEEARKRDIKISNTPGVLTDTVAEHTFALIMAISRRIVEADKFTREGKYVGWAPELFLGSGLKGKTIGIVGVGRIGSRVAGIAKNGYEMNVVYNDLTQNDTFEETFNATFYDSLSEMLKVADIITIHVPLIDSTRHLINKEMLSNMKKSAYLINTSRGPIVDEKALVVALREGTIKGAAIDVFEDEPKLADGLSELSNIIITPHIASATEETRSKMSEMAAKNIVAVLEGNTPPNLI
jgi:glyoxylate reductase